MERKAIIEFKDFTAHYTVQSKPTLNNINLTYPHPNRPYSYS